MQIASRLENQISYNSSTETFRPLADELAVVKEFYPDNESVISIKTI